MGHERLEGMPGDEKTRLFVGVPLPDDLLPCVLGVQDTLRGLPGIRLMTREQLHVTLAFIGEVGRAKLEAAAHIVENVPQRLGGVAWLAGLLPLPTAGRARVISLAVEDREGVFARLFEHVMGGLEQAGVMQRERRPYKPHLTIARLRVPTAVQLKADYEPARFEVSSVCLYKSELARTGAVYTALVRRVLEGPQ